MEKGLMELVEACEQINQPYQRENSALEKASELEKLGFNELAQNMFKEIERKNRLARLSEFCYIKITENKIKAFLQGKVDTYNKTHPQKKEKSRNGGLIYVDWAGSISDFGISPGSMYFSNGSYILNSTSIPPVPQTRKISPVLVKTNDFNKTDKETIGQYLWKETDIAEYKTIPPGNILDVLKLHKARNVFDYFTIASVEHIPDPLLLGRIDGIEDRFFIAQWGDDIQLDDVI